MNNSAVLLISCPDRKGLVAAISDFVFRHGGNILHADEHGDESSNLFLMRVEFEASEFDIDFTDFPPQFSAIADRFQMEWQLARPDHRSKMAILVSRYDHCLVDLLYRHKSGELACDIPLIVSNHAENQAIAEFYGIPFFFVPTLSGKKTQAEKEVLHLLKKHDPDLIVLARYMQILSPEFVAEYEHRIINIHHSFLPAFVGAKPYQQAFARGVKLIGATSHYVTDVLDDGPIIEQDVIRISHQDSVEHLLQKGRDLERVVLSRAVRWHLENRILLYGNKTVVFH
jgi:formyltetrahydrofolate deformylase